MPEAPKDEALAPPRLLPRVIVWSSVTLAGLCLLTVGGWLGCRWWLKSKLDKAPQALMLLSGQPGGTDTDLARLLRNTDFLPDAVVYPVLIEMAQRPGNWEVCSSKNCALRLLEIRAYGGCRRLLAERGDFLDTARPVPSAARWIRRMPWQMLADLYAVSHPFQQRPFIMARDENGRVTRTEPIMLSGASLPFLVGGSRLIRVLEPGDPRWRKDVHLDEVRRAHERLGTGLPFVPDPKGGIR